MPQEAPTYRAGSVAVLGRRNGANRSVGHREDFYSIWDGEPLPYVERVGSVSPVAGGAGQCLNLPCRAASPGATPTASRNRQSRFRAAPLGRRLPHQHSRANSGDTDFGCRSCGLWSHEFLTGPADFGVGLSPLLVLICRSDTACFLRFGCSGLWVLDGRSMTGEGEL